MADALFHLLRKRQQRPPAAVPAGQRVYAIGDVHGRCDLFSALSKAIDCDDVSRHHAETTVILLGDLVDRGPDSAGVIEAAMLWAGQRRVRLIAANHEEMFLCALDDVDAFRQFIRIGGRETILSYGVSPAAFHVSTAEEAQELARAAVPQSHRHFLSLAEPQITIGDYLFAHAGIRPGVPHDAQRGEDLRWIREPFLSSTADHGCVVVHGHSISDEPVVRFNRIGIDTGAFQSGRLTALGLEGSQRWLIEAGENAEGIAITCRSA